MEYTIEEFVLSHLPELRRIRKNSYGDFDVLRFTKFCKKRNDLVWVLKSEIAQNKVVGYIILYERASVDAWIYQIGCKNDVLDEGIQLLIKKAEEILQKKNHEKIRVLIRDNDNIRIINSLIGRGWKKIDSIWIMERSMSYKSDIIDIKNIPDNIQIVEADVNKHLEGVVHVDRAAFIFGHRVPKERLADHLGESGAFVAIDNSDNSVVGYNYNTIDNNDIGHFIRLATLPDYRRKGIASQLILEALNWFENVEIKSIYLRTIPDSAGSHLYKKYNFIHSQNESTFEINLGK